MRGGSSDGAQGFASEEGIGSCNGITTSTQLCDPNHVSDNSKLLSLQNGGSINGFEHYTELS
jgi:hypothetical protein